MAPPLLARLRQRLEADPWGSAAATVALASMLCAVGIVMAPWLASPWTFGFHDWDVQTSHRELVRRTIVEHFEFPFWNPYACGGFTAWGYVEGGTVVVSPLLPIYLALPMSIALRVEVLAFALLGAFGAYAVASRFTESHAARALVAALWAVDGRWGLQTASGHTWHLSYALMPWALFFFERARSTPRARTADLLGMSGCFALLVYWGGIYPLPHTVLVLSLYAAVLSIQSASVRPIALVGVAGALAVCLAAPKLLPLLAGFAKAPRLIESKETLDVGALLTMLVSRDQAFYSRPARVSPYGWHEWGIYVSWAGVAALGLGFVFATGRRVVALKAVGAAMIILGFGAFHPSAPWTLLHAHVPVFKSQHVPSRFLYPAVLLLGIVAASWIGRAITRRRHTAAWLDVVAAAFVLAIAVDVARVSAKPMAGAMWMVPPPIPRDRPFSIEQEPAFNYVKRDWAGPVYLPMLGNTGVFNCYGAPPFEPRGALPKTDPRYRGEAYVVGGGAAKLASWSPNRAVVEVTAAAPGAVLVYNTNHDPGWSSDAGAVIEHEGKVAVRLNEGDARVTLRYRSPGFGVGLAMALAAAGAFWWMRRRERAWS
jgi:hypothetical protein